MGWSVSRVMGWAPVVCVGGPMRSMRFSVGLGSALGWCVGACSRGPSY